jgi:GNAT superfamily N-acetyltransferase
VSTPDITFDILDGTGAAAHGDELQALYAEVFAGPAHPGPAHPGPADGRDGEATRFSGRFRVQRRQPGYVLAEARHGGYLVGYAAGFPLRPSTSWWRQLTTPLPDEVTAEHPGRTFAVVDLAVRPSWRRQGIGAALHRLVLRDRPEERATLILLPSAVPAQRAFQAWGWRKVARTRDPAPGSPVADVFVTALPLGP